MYVEFDVEVKPPRTTLRGRSITRRKATRLPTIVKTLVLAYQIEQAIDEGRAKDYAEIASQMGVSRARISQIVRLRYLAPTIQELLLTTKPEHVAGGCQAQLRAIASEPDWRKQQKQFDALCSQCTSTGIRS